MTTNEHPSMQTWQADTYVTWAVLGEIIAALDIDEKIDWERVVDVALLRSKDDTLDFIKETVRGVRGAVAQAKYQLGQGLA